MQGLDARKQVKAAAYRYCILNERYQKAMVQPIYQAVADLITGKSARQRANSTQNSACYDRLARAETHCGATKRAAQETD